MEREGKGQWRRCDIFRVLSGPFGSLQVLALRSS